MRQHQRSGRSTHEGLAARQAGLLARYALLLKKVLEPEMPAAR